MANQNKYRTAVPSHPQYEWMSQKIIAMMNPHKNRILQVAQSSLSASQFSAFKKLFLDEFGQKGLESELTHLLLTADSQHTLAWHGQEQTTQERRCHHE